MGRKKSQVGTKAEQAATKSSAEVTAAVTEGTEVVASDAKAPKLSVLKRNCEIAGKEHLAGASVYLKPAQAQFLRSAGAID